MEEVELQPELARSRRARTQHTREGVNNLFLGNVCAARSTGRI